MAANDEQAALHRGYRKRIRVGSPIMPTRARCLRGKVGSGASGGPAEKNIPNPIVKISCTERPARGL
jgi:hypothetical protein